jgi:sporulation protein YabP
MSAQLTRPPGKLILDARKKLTLTGATEVVRFDEDLVELNTDLGPLLIEGSGLKLKCLSLDDGTIIVEGDLCALHYEVSGRKRGLLR